jgi:hypothetical protein
MDNRSWLNIPAALQVYLSHYFVRNPSLTWAELQNNSMCMMSICTGEISRRTSLLSHLVVQVRVY